MKQSYFHYYLQIIESIKVGEIKINCPIHTVSTVRVIVTFKVKKNDHPYSLNDILSL